MSLTIKGTEEFLRMGAASPLFQVPGLSYLGIRKRRTPLYGWTYVLEFKSAASNDPSQPSAAESACNLVPEYYVAECEARGPVHTLTVTTPDEPAAGTNGVISTTFELLGNALQKDLKEHPRALALGPDVIAEIDAVIAGDKKYNEADFPSKDDAIALYDRMRQRNGSASYQTSQYVLRVSQIASARTSIEIAHRNVECIYTTNQMIGEVGPPPGIMAGIPEIEANKIASLEKLNYHVWLEKYVVGWLKQTPTVTTEAGNKIRVTQEFWFEAWDNWTYDTI